MVNQRELVEDDDVEHFEDVKEEDDIDPNKGAEKEENVVEVHHDGGRIASKDGGSSSDDEEALAIRQSDDEDDYASDDAEELFIRKTPSGIEETMEVSNNSEKTSQPPVKSSSLPGGYDPRHREPSYCNADRASWWELVVLSSHAHPSVATMAGTLLSGTNIIYNGNPLNDLSLTAFLDKFMEKKPKQNTWHGGSQIEPSKKLDMSNHMIGSEILSLAEEDVAPEDLVFHKFYVNKMNSGSLSKKKKKKKKLPEEEAAEELYEVNDGDGGDDYGSDVEFEAGDESDNEEIENMLDDVDDNAVEEEGGEYDYDDLDGVAGDDDELVGDAEMDTDMDMDMLDGEDIDDDVAEDGGDHSDADDDDDDEEGRGGKKKKEKRKRKSPFASFEDYKDLIDQDDKDDSKSKRDVTSEPKKKKKKKTKSSSQ